MLSTRHRISEATSCLSESGRDSNSLRSCSTAIDLFNYLFNYYFSTDATFFQSFNGAFSAPAAGSSTVRCILLDRSSMTRRHHSNPRFTLPRGHLSRVIGIVPNHMTMPALFGYRCSQRVPAIWTWRCHSPVPFRPNTGFTPSVSKNRAVAE